jgi:hypothetical protein
MGVQQGKTSLEAKGFTQKRQPGGNVEVGLPNRQAVEIELEKRGSEAKSHSEKPENQCSINQVEMAEGVQSKCNQGVRHI